MRKRVIVKLRVDVEVFGGYERPENGRYRLGGVVFCGGGEGGGGGRVWRRRRGHGPEFASGCAVERVELAIHGGDEDDIEDLEGVIVSCSVSARGEEVQAADGVFGSSEITAESDGLLDRGGGQNEKAGKE